MRVSCILLACLLYGSPSIWAAPASASKVPGDSAIAPVQTSAFEADPSNQTRTRLTLEPDLALANRYFKEGDLFLTIAELEKAKQAAPDSVRVQTLLGELYNRIGAYQDALDTAIKVLKAVPESSQPHAIMGTAYLGLNDPTSAVTHYQKFIEKVPNQAVGYYRLAEVYFTYGQLPEALRLYNAALSRDPNLGDAQFKRALTLHGLGYYQEAFDRIQELLKIHPNEPLLYAAMGNILRDSENGKEAEEVYQTAIQLGPDLPYYRELLAQFYLRQAKIDQAIDQYEQILESNRDYVKAHRQLVDLYKQKGDRGRQERHLGFLAWVNGKPQEAIGHYRVAVKLDPELKSAQLEMAAVYLYLGDTDAAASITKSVLKGARKDPTARTLLGEIYRAAGNIKGAEKQFRKAIDYYPGFVTAYMDLADLFSDTGRCFEAVSHYQRVLLLEPEEAQAYRRLGDCYQSSGAVEKAVEHYKSALQITPNDPLILNSLAWVYAKYEVNIIEALILAKKAAVLSPNDPVILDTLGWAYYLDGHLQLAVENLTLAAKALSEEPTVLFHLGTVYYETGDKKQAMVALRQALKVNPEFPEARVARSLIRKIEPKTSATSID